MMRNLHFNAYWDYDEPPLNDYCIECEAKLTGDERYETTCTGCKLDWKEYGENK